MFKDREEAGRGLAAKLSSYKGKKDVLVLGIPRGGIATAAEIARELTLPLDIVVVKKIGAPHNEELAVGAVGLNEIYLNVDVVRSSEVSQDYIAKIAKEKQKEVKRRYALLRGKKPMYTVKGKIIILVDDGVATGATMMMAIKIIRQQSPAKIIVAIPVAPPETVRELEKEADTVVCLERPAFFMAIGQFYEQFPQIEDKIAKRMLQEMWRKFSGK